jgi:hypothetical protein
MLLIEGKHLKGGHKLGEKAYAWRIFKQTRFDIDHKMQNGDVAMVVSKAANGKSFVSPVVITKIYRVSSDEITKDAKNLNVVLKVCARA